MPQNPQGSFTPEEIERMARLKEQGRGGIGLYNTAQSAPQPAPQPGLMTRALSGLRGLFGGLQNESPAPRQRKSDIYLPMEPGETIDPRLSGLSIANGGASPYGR